MYSFPDVSSTDVLQCTHSLTSLQLTCYNVLLTHLVALMSYIMIHNDGRVCMLQYCCEIYVRGVHDLVAECSEGRGFVPGNISFPCDKHCVCHTKLLNGSHRPRTGGQETR